MWGSTQPASMKRKAEAAPFALGDVDRGEGPREFERMFRPRKICQFFLQGRCQKGGACTFAHHPEELHPESQEAFTTEDGQVFDTSAPAEEGAATFEQLVDAYQAEMDEQQAEAGVEKQSEPRPSPRFVQATPVASAISGPREFPLHQPPPQLCEFWMQHPTECSMGDQCPMAHGLIELGLSGATVSLEVNPAPEACGSGFKAKGGGGGMMKGGPSKGGLAKGGPAKGGPAKEGTAKEGPAKGGYPGKAAFPWKGAASPVTLESRFDGSGFTPVKLCQFWLQNPAACKKGYDCSFAHGIQELNPNHRAGTGVSRFLHTGYFPTQYCAAHTRAGSCAQGMNCPMAHGPEEMSA
mmetsp:Transcript_13344/g.35815  ORF Transcript_13344/g.35815 Transcript_13344/m.35815 type:complete len:352 (-) Transcript_13344:25-1080(-)|eukprot:CAMPEP_0117497796 /NCGR_PEP_ID=MMETSP0784-20121206/21373_1 /TAXON_ID=39447 /ORGANISM="" /LENGTH=351 /DNA_ID=CAMNT_0005292841 /DNA_START=41 /DNA_END=1096 /DNA_ORIENTATION=+